MINIAWRSNLLGGIYEISRNSGCNLHIEVFSVGLFMEKSRTAVCDDPMHACAAEITLTHGHVWSVPGERTTSFTPNVPQEHRHYTNLYKLMTAGGPHLRNSIYIHVGLREAGNGNAASLDSH